MFSMLQLYTKKTEWFEYLSPHVCLKMNDGIRELWFCTYIYIYIGSFFFVVLHKRRPWRRSLLGETLIYCSWAVSTCFLYLGPTARQRELLPRLFLPKQKSLAFCLKMEFGRNLIWGTQRCFKSLAFYLKTKSLLHFTLKWNSVETWFEVHNDIWGLSDFTLKSKVSCILP